MNFSEFEMLFTERKVNEEIPCLRQLLHWNMSTNEGKGKTHEELERRLRQMNRNDLAEWLGKETFKQLGKDLGRALDHPFGEFDEEQIEITCVFYIINYLIKKF